MSHRDFTPFPRRVLLATSVVASVALLLLIAWQIPGVLLVLFAAILLAIFLDAMALGLARLTRLPRRVALYLGLALLLALVGGFVGLAGGPIGSQVAELQQRLPEALAQLRVWIAQLPLGAQLLASHPGSRVLGRVPGMFSFALGGVIDMVLVVLIGIYLAHDPAPYIAGVLRLLPLERRARGAEVMRALGQALRWWLVGRAAAMFAVGLLTSAALAAIGVPLALALGVIAALFSFVPFVGPSLAAIPALLVALLVSPVLMLNVFIVYITVQSLEGYLITPFIQKRAVSIAPALLLGAQMLIGVLFGLFGLVLATPLAVSFTVLVQMLYVEDVLGDTVEVLGTHHHRRRPVARGEGS